jgi:peptide/nickel transport system ATP-binding protein
MLEGSASMNEILLEARNLKKQYELPAVPFGRSKIINALDGVSITLRQGETLGLAGESGCGKSTVARLLMGLDEPTSGDILFRGRELSRFNRAEKFSFRRSIQMIFQDPYSSLNPRMRIGDIIGEPLLIHRSVPGSEQKEKVLALMNQVGLPPEQYDRYPHQFSGGQRQRIGVARALALTPEIIIADEPLSALDISIQAQIINLLLNLQKTLRLSYLLISHDLAVIRHLSSRVAVMYLGRIVEQAGTEAIFNSPLHPYTTALLAAIPGFGTATRAATLLGDDLPSPIATPSGCPFHPRCPYKQEICTSEAPVLEEKSAGHFAACHFSNNLSTC